MEKIDKKVLLMEKYHLSRGKGVNQLHEEVDKVDFDQELESILKGVIAAYPSFSYDNLYEEFINSVKMAGHFKELPARNVVDQKINELK